MLHGVKHLNPKRSAGSTSCRKCVGLDVIFCARPSCPRAAIQEVSALQQKVVLRQIRGALVQCALFAGLIEPGGEIEDAAMPLSRAITIALLGDESACTLQR